MRLFDAGVRRQFSRAAEYYHLDPLAREVAGDILALLRESPEIFKALREEGRRGCEILDYGCGTGVLLGQCLELFPGARGLGVDLAPGMLQVAAGQSVQASRIEWRCADIFHCDFENDFPLVLSSLALQWMQPIAGILSRTRSWLAPGGTFLGSTMLFGSLGSWRRLRQELYPDKSPRVELPTAEEFCESLVTSGFVLEKWVRKSFLRSYPTAWGFLSSLKKLGFTGGELSQQSRPLTRRELAILVAAYEAKQGREGVGVSANFEVGYFLARGDGVRCE